MKLALTVVPAVLALTSVALAEVTLPAADAKRGRELFISKGCIGCHAINVVGGAHAAPLDAATMDPTGSVFEYFARMWLGMKPMIEMVEDKMGQQIDLTAFGLAGGHMNTLPALLKLNQPSSACGSFSHSSHGRRRKLRELFQPVPSPVPRLRGMGEGARRADEGPVRARDACHLFPIGLYSFHCSHRGDGTRAVETGKRCGA